MLITDVIISIIATIVVAVALFMNEEKIDEWAKSKQGHNLEWRG